MIRLQETDFSLVRFYRLLSPHPLMNQASMLDRSMWKERKLPLNNIQGGTEAFSQTAQEELSQELRSRNFQCETRDDCSPANTLTAACKRSWNRGPAKRYCTLNS